MHIILYAISMYIKIFVGVICLYLILGAFFATRFALRYDPVVTSAPNSVTTFVLNMMLWSL